MEILLRFLGFYFILVALPRVAIFANRFVPNAPDGWLINPFGVLGIFFAAGLGMGVYVASYFATSDTTYSEDQDDVDEGSLTPAQRRMLERKQRVRTLKKRAARRALIVGALFAFLDSLFNLAEVGLVATEKGQIVSLWQPLNRDYITLAAVWAFGLVPTFSSFLAGWLVSAVDQIPANYRKTSLPSLAVILGHWLKPRVHHEDKHRLQPAKRVLVSTNGKKKKFTHDVQRGDLDIVSMSSFEIAKRYGVSERTAYRWKATLQGGNNHEI